MFFNVFYLQINAFIIYGQIQSPDPNINEESMLLSGWDLVRGWRI